MKKSITAEICSIRKDVGELQSWVTMVKREAESEDEDLQSTIRKELEAVDITSRINLENLKKAMHLEKETRDIVQDEFEEIKKTSLDMEKVRASLRTEFGKGSAYDTRISEIESQCTLLKNDALTLTSAAYDKRLKALEEKFTELRNQLNNQPRLAPQTLKTMNILTLKTIRISIWKTKKMMTREKKIILRI